MINNSFSDTVHNYTTFSINDNVCVHVYIKGKSVTKNMMVLAQFTPVAGESEWPYGNPHGISSESYYLGNGNSDVPFGGMVRGKIKVQIRLDKEIIAETYITIK